MRRRTVSVPGTLKRWIRAFSGAVELDELDVRGGLDMLRKPGGSRRVEVLGASTNAAKVVRGKQQRTKVKMPRIVFG